MGGRRLRYFDSILGRSRTNSLYTELKGSVFCSVKVDVDDDDDDDEDEVTAKRSLVNRSIGARIYPSRVLKINTASSSSAPNMSST
jgi:hypothetical protein